MSYLLSSLGRLRRATLVARLAGLTVESLASGLRIDQISLSTRTGGFAEIEVLAAPVPRGPGPPSRRFPSASPPGMITRASRGRDRSWRAAGSSERRKARAREGRLAVGRPRILFVACTPLEDRPSMGVDQRLRILHDGFARVGDVTVHQPASPDDAPARKGFPLGAARDEATKSAVLHPDLRRRRPRTATAERFRSMAPERFDVVFLHRLGSAWWTGWTDPRRTILDIDDIPSQIYRDRMRYGTALKRIPRWLLGHWVRRCERRHLDAFRFSLVCSEEDRRYLDHPRVAVVPNAFWIPEGTEIPDRVDGEGSLLFVGSLGYPPNAEGLAWFVGTILPRVRAKVPEATLTVVGRTPRGGEARLGWREAPGVRFVGTVDDVTPYIREAKLEVCPLLRGQGTRVKILESLAHGKPVISTAIGAYGIEIGDPEGIIRRDDPESFADACTKLLTDAGLRAARGEAGRRYVLEHASPAAMQRRLAELVGTILAEQGMAGAGDA